MSVTEAASEAAAGLIADILGEETPVAPAPVGEQPAPQAPVEEPAVEAPSFEADTSGLDFLDDEPEPTYDEEDEQTFEPVNFEEPEEGEYVDPEVQKLKSQLKKMQAQVEHERGLRKASKEKDWKAEAQRRFPLCDSKTLTGDSRRALLRNAKEQHDRVYAIVKPKMDELVAARGAVLNEAREEGRAAARDAWGQPTAGPNQAHIATTDANERDPNQHDRTQYGSLLDSVRARVFQGGYGERIMRDR